MKKCPNCKGTKFSVKSLAFQTYYSDMESWGDIHIEDTIGEKPFFCVNCEKEFKEEDLEIVK